MEREEQRELRIGAPTVEDMLTDFSALEYDRIRKRVLENIAEIGHGEYTEYERREGLDRLFAGVKTRERKLVEESRGK